MDYEPLVKQLPGLREEAQLWRDRAEEASAQVANLDRIIAGIEGLRRVPAPMGQELPGMPRPTVKEAPTVNGDARDTPQTDSPRGIAAVRAAMREQPDRIWKAREIHEVLSERGWLTSDAKHPLRGTETAIYRMRQAGEVEAIEPGRYRYRGREGA